MREKKKRKEERNVCVCVCVEMRWNTGDNGRVQTLCVVPLLVSAILEGDLSSHALQQRVMNDSWRIKLQRREGKLICECVCVSTSPMRVCAWMQRRRMFSCRPGQKWLPLWWKGRLKVRRCVEKRGFEIVSQWLWLPSAGPGHYITESLLSSPWEWLTA